MGMGEEPSYERRYDGDPGTRFSTGIESFDSALKGGIPVGSIILLISEEGAGGREYALLTNSVIKGIRWWSSMQMKAMIGLNPPVPQVRLC